MKPYEPWEFCKAIDCPAFPGIIFGCEDTKKIFCRKCHAYQMHQYLKDHGQILEEGSGLIARVREAEAELATHKRALTFFIADTVDDECPYEHDFVNWPECKDCPHDREMHVDRERDLKCWEKYCLEIAERGNE